MPVQNRKRLISAGVAVLAVAALAGCEENTYRGNDRAAEKAPKEPAAEVVDAGKAIREADPGQVFPLPIGRDEASKVVSDAEICTFRMTSSDFPEVIIAKGVEGQGDAKAVMKVNGKLFELTPSGSQEDEIVLEADGVRASIEPEDGDEDPREAALHFKVEGAEELGYWGYYSCAPDDTNS